MTHYIVIENACTCDSQFSTNWLGAGDQSLVIVGQIFHYILEASDYKFHLCSWKSTSNNKSTKVKCILICAHIHAHMCKYLLSI